jgi:hypothetical protein
VLTYRMDIIKTLRTMYRYVLKKAILETNYDTGLSYYRATYSNGIREMDEFYQLDELIPTILEENHF